MVAKSTSAALVFWSKVSPQTTEAFLVVFMKCLFICFEVLRETRVHVRYENQILPRFDEKISRYSNKSVALLLFNVQFGVLLEKFRFFMLCNKEFGSGNAVN